MPQSAIDSQIQSRVEQFVDELSGLIREAAFDAVHLALGNGAAPRSSPRPSKKASRKQAPNGRIRRSPADLGRLSGTLVAHVRSNPGQRLEEIGTALRVDTATLKQPIAMLLAEGKLKKAGLARGTNYTVGRTGGAKKATRKKGGRRKRAARKTAAK